MVWASFSAADPPSMTHLKYVHKIVVLKLKQHNYMK